MKHGRRFGKGSTRACYDYSRSLGVANALTIIHHRSPDTDTIDAIEKCFADHIRSLRRWRKSAIAHGSGNRYEVEGGAHD